jgi:hypothetical protein
MTLQLAGHINDLLSTFLSAMFAESNRRNLKAAYMGGHAGFAHTRSMVLEEFRDLMESAILNNGALSDADISSLHLYPGDTPSPDKRTWGAWGKHVATYQATHATNFDVAIRKVLFQWVRMGTSWTDEPLSGAQITMRQPGGSSVLVLFRCLQHVVHSVVFGSPWLYMPMGQALKDRLAVIDAFKVQAQVALINAYVQVDDPALSSAVVAELRRAFTENMESHLRVTRPQPRLRDMASADATTEGSDTTAQLDESSEDESESSADESEQMDESSTDASSVHSSVTDITVTVLKLSDCVHVDPSLNMEDCCQWVKTEPVMRGDSDLMIEKTPKRM